MSFYIKSHDNYYSSDVLSVYKVPVTIPVYTSSLYKNHMKLVLLFLFYRLEKLGHRVK